MDNSNTGTTNNPNWDQIKEQLEKYNTYQSKAVCPQCGYCPHCGRGGHFTRPYGPYNPWYNEPYITWTVSTTDGLWK